MMRNNNEPKHEHLNEIEITMIREVRKIHEQFTSLVGEREYYDITCFVCTKKGLLIIGGEKENKEDLTNTYLTPDYKSKTRGLYFHFDSKDYHDLMTEEEIKHYSVRNIPGAVTYITYEELFLAGGGTGFEWVEAAIRTIDGSMLDMVERACRQDLFCGYEGDHPPYFNHKDLKSLRIFTEKQVLKLMGVK